MSASSSFFTDSQIELVTDVLNRIIPPSGKMPGAGEIAVDYLDQAVGGSPGLKRIFGRGLLGLEVNARRDYSRDFHDLSGEQQDAVLRLVEADEAEFFDLLVRQTYNGYYTESRIVKLLGLENRPPQPLGYQVEQGHIALIENVKNRGTFYRDV